MDGNMEANKVDSIHQEAFLPFTQLEDLDIVCPTSGPQGSRCNTCLNEPPLYSDPSFRSLDVLDDMEVLDFGLPTATCGARQVSEFDRPTLQAALRSTILAPSQGDVTTARTK
uniref:Uncharacterized protein n=1 Tax=Timema douglasi TaxID=61478 RepID=A0A7R8Z711_TIMDO|nr:unnamed protein product [Timema douglasi]